MARLARFARSDPSRCTAAERIHHVHVVTAIVNPAPTVEAIPECVDSPRLAAPLIVVEPGPFLRPGGGENDQMCPIRRPFDLPHPRENSLTIWASPPSAGMTATCGGSSLPGPLRRNANLVPSGDHRGDVSPRPVVNGFVSPSHIQIDRT